MNLLYDTNAITHHSTAAYSIEIVQLYSPLQNASNKLIKRVFDIMFSGAVIVLILSWLIPIVGILIKLSSNGPVFFLQKRHGLHNRLFNCIKFRTMRSNKEEIVQATKGDARITFIGKFLRQTNIDEFPQFLNVFIGDMSVVGPRPHFYMHNQIFAQHIDGFMTRHWIRPGITGLAQTKGYRGQVKNTRAIALRFKMDRFYIENWSLLLDVMIIVKTFVSTFLKPDANAC